jgi:hypothetical protein
MLVNKHAAFCLALLSISPSIVLPATVKDKTYYEKNAH